jgi:hypothetical protein
MIPNSLEKMQTVPYYLDQVAKLGNWNRYWTAAQDRPPLHGELIVKGVETRVFMKGQPDNPEAKLSLGNSLQSQKGLDGFLIPLAVFCRTNMDYRAW